MGLPIFREPTVIETKATARTDPSATSRSAIRRQRTIRHPPVRDGSLTTHSSRVDRSLRHRSSLLDIVNRERERDRDLRTSRSHEPLPDLVDGPRPYTSSLRPTEASIEASRREAGERSRRDAIRYERSGRRTRESALRFGMLPPVPPLPENYRAPIISSNRQWDSVHSRFMPSPPYSAHDNRSNRASPVARTTASPPLNPNSFTPRFAPAYPVNRDNEPSVGFRNPPLSPDGAVQASVTYVDDTIRRPSLTPLRHHGDRSIANLRHHHRHRYIDGLGDRLRSPSPASPSSNNSENDTWETLLTTIAPDEHLPSTDSSFTSAAATSFSGSGSGRSGSARSSQTLLTAPSSTMEEDGYGEEFGLGEACNIPEESSDDNSEADPETEHREDIADDGRRYTNRIPDIFLNPPPNTQGITPTYMRAFQAELHREMIADQVAADRRRREQLERASPRPAPVRPPVDEGDEIPQPMTDAEWRERLERTRQIRLQETGPDRLITEEHIRRTRLQEVADDRRRAAEEAAFQQRIADLNRNQELEPPGLTPREQAALENGEELADSDDETSQPPTPRTRSVLSRERQGRIEDIPEETLAELASRWRELESVAARTGLNAGDLERMMGLDGAEERRSAE